jgi:hypothetical protein
MLFKMDAESQASTIHPSMESTANRIRYRFLSHNGFRHPARAGLEKDAPEFCAILPWIFLGHYRSFNWDRSEGSGGIKLKVA